MGKFAGKLGSQETEKSNQGEGRVKSDVPLLLPRKHK